MLITSGNTAARKPSSIPVINRGSWQAKGLVAWFTPPLEVLTQQRGTLTNNAGLRPSPWGPAWWFDNAGNSSTDLSGSYIELPDTAVYDITGPQTLSAWVSFLTPSTWNANRGIISKFQEINDVGTSVSEDSYNLRISSAKLLSYAVNPTGGSAATVSILGATTLVAGVLYHLAGRYIPSTAISVWVDGRKDGENTTSIPASLYSGAAPVRVGCQTNSRERVSLYGYIIDARIYDYAMSDAQILNLYKNRWGLYNTQVKNWYVDKISAAEFVPYQPWLHRGPVLAQ